jgi:EmrB/QacA subfamily drug resistance transporter
MQIPAPATRRGGLSYKWLVAVVVIFGIFMSVLDSTIVNIAIPRLQSVFGADINSVQWVLTAYIMAQGVATPLTGFFSDRIGTKRFYLISLAAFTLGSALCGVAWSLPVLIFFRILQGAGGAFLLPLSIALLYREFPPEERGTALGALGIPILLAPAFGPTVGGYVVTFADWPLIFYINVPIGIMGIILGSLLLHEGQIDRNVRFDVAGFLLSAFGLAALLYGLSDASTDGWGSGKVLICLAGGILLLAVFTFVELRTARLGLQPLLDLRVFANGPFLTSNLASIIVTFALYGGLFVVPIYLQNLRDLSAFQAGLLLLPQAFASMVTVVLGGRLVDRFGVRAVVIPGLIILAISLWVLSTATLNTPYGTFQAMLIVRAVALGLCIQPLTVSALSEIQPRQLAQASAVNTALRFIASSLGVAILATLIQTQTKIHYSHLAELATPTSPLGQLVTRLQALFVSRGASLFAAQSAALSEISGLLRRQAYMLAIQDAFLFSLALSIVAIVVSFFVRSRRSIIPNDAPPTTPTPTSAEDQEAARAREEAMLGV